MVVAVQCHFHSFPVRMLNSLLSRLVWILCLSFDAQTNDSSPRYPAHVSFCCRYFQLVLNRIGMGCNIVFVIMKLTAFME